MNGLDVITSERRVQRGMGFTPETDDGYTNGELLVAAQHYLAAARNLNNDKWEMVFHRVEGKIMPLMPKNWPLDPERWDPSEVVKNNIKKAGALLVAEWDRLDRAGL